MGYNKAVQILRRADELKEKLLAVNKSDLLNDSKAWTNQQCLLGLYHSALITDLEYALDQKVDQDLWNVGIKARITILQEAIRDKKHPKRSEYQTLLSICLETASGYLISLLNELCDLYGIDLPFRRKLNGFVVNTTPTTELPQSASCLYICQYCLVHLGDIARYRNQRKQAEQFYKHAIFVSPNSGHPYNQLALLEASQGNKLATIFYYIRGLAVKNPFPACSTNLLSTLSSTIDKERYNEMIQRKLTADTFIQLFLSTHGLLHTKSDLDCARGAITKLNAALTPLVAMQSFTSDSLIKMTTINLYAYLKYNDKKSSEICNDAVDVSKGDVLAKTLALDFIAGSLNAFLVPVYTLKDNKGVLDYCALPSVKIIINWIGKDSIVLNDPVFTSRVQIWPSFCKLLNYLNESLRVGINESTYKNLPCSEDKMLEGFLPLQDAFSNIDFTSQSFVEADVEKLIRARQIMDFGCYLCDLDVLKHKLISRKEDGKFEPVCLQPDPTNDLLEEMKSLNATSDTNKECKRTGILKPQGSLERSREERSHENHNNGDPNHFSLLPDTNNCSSSNANILSTPLSKLTLGSNSSNPNLATPNVIGNKRLPKQNAALNSILKRMDQKVTFNVSDKEPLLPTPVSINSDQPLLSTNSVLGPFNQPPPCLPMSSYTSSLRNDHANNTNSAAHNLNVLNSHNFLPNATTPTPMTNVMPPMPPTNWWPPIASPPNSGYNTTNTDNARQLAPTTMATPFSSSQSIHSNDSGLNCIPNASSLFFNQPPPPWGPYNVPPPPSIPQQSSFVGLNADDINSRNQQNAITLRQAMLNDSNKIQENGMIGSVSYKKEEMTPQSYSLFNTTSWGPSLVNQLNTGNSLNSNSTCSNNRTIEPNCLSSSDTLTFNSASHHSLFASHGPQSLAQLLQQQQQSQNNM